MNTKTKDAIGRIGNTIHRSVFLATNGRLMGKFYGMPVVLLTTTGRKSGKKRQTMLTSPVQKDGNVVLVASWGGDHRHPTWYLNLRDNPNVEATFDGKRRAMRARTASGEEKSELWQQVIAKYKGYAGYRTKTSRDIPLVVLEPRQV